MDLWKNDTRRDQLASAFRDAGFAVPTTGHAYPLDPITIDLDGAIREVGAVIMTGYTGALDGPSIAAWLSGWTASNDSEAPVFRAGSLRELKLTDGTDSVIIVLLPEDYRWNPPRREA